MQWLWLAVWFSTGFATMVYLRWEGRHAFAWGDLVLCAGMGVAGPIIPLAIAVSVVPWADILNRPIWPARNRH